MKDILNRFLAVLRQPEAIGAIATLLFGLVREFVPGLQQYVTIEFLAGVIALLLGTGAARYVKNRL